MRTRTNGADAGHFLLDIQHQQVFDSLARLETMIGKGEPLSVTVPFFNRTLQYMALHFRAEEELMLEIGYPYLHVHQRLHEALLDAFEALKSDLPKGELACAGQLVGLGRELIAHQDQADRDLRLYIRYEGRRSRFSTPLQWGVGVKSRAGAA